MAIVGTQATRDRCLELEEHDGQLLPGIPNDITLNQIAPKLSWRDFHILSSVNHCWLDAIRSHQVYDARVRNQSTETLVLLSSDFQFQHGGSYALYSMKGHSFGYALPPNPYLPEGIIFPRESRCVSLEGKIYVIGGSVAPGGFDIGTEKVYALNVAGQGQWKQCASMEKPRVRFGCAVVDGKIYVCGGVYSDRKWEPVCESEVYDPTEDIWFPIEPMLSLRFSHSVVTVGEELFAHGGWFRGDISSGNSTVFGGYDRDDLDTLSTASAYFLEVYHPIKDEWRLSEPPLGYNNDYDKFFAAKGKFYRSSVDEEDLDVKHIHVLDADENSWTHLHSFSFPHRLDDYASARRWNILAVNHELLAEVWWMGGRGFSVLRSIGFGSEIKEIAWQELRFFVGNYVPGSCFKCHIEL